MFPPDDGPVISTPQDRRNMWAAVNGLGVSPIMDDNGEFGDEDIENRLKPARGKVLLPFLDLFFVRAKDL